MSVRYVDKHGNEVPEGDPRSAYQINDNDPASDRLLERLRRDAPRKPQPVKSVPVEVEPPKKSKSVPKGKK